MRTGTIVVGLLIGALSTSSCASVVRDAVVDAYEGTTNEPDPADSDGDGDNTIGRIGVDAIANIRAFDCGYDERALDVAIETYVALNDMNPSSMSELAKFGLIQDQSQRWTVEAPPDDNDPAIVTPIPGAGCDE